MHGVILFIENDKQQQSEHNEANYNKKIKKREKNVCTHQIVHAHYANKKKRYINTVVEKSERYLLEDMCTYTTAQKRRKPASDTSPSVRGEEKNTLHEQREKKLIKSIKNKYNN